MKLWEILNGWADKTQPFYIPKERILEGWAYFNVYSSLPEITGEEEVSHEVKISYGSWGFGKTYLCPVVQKERNVTLFLAFMNYWIMAEDRRILRDWAVNGYRPVSGEWYYEHLNKIGRLIF